MCFGRSGGFAPVIAPAHFENSDLEFAVRDKADVVHAQIAATLFPSWQTDGHSEAHDYGLRPVLMMRGRATPNSRFRK
jgi:hypothetical protein